MGRLTETNPMGVLGRIRAEVLGPRIASIGCSGFLTTAGLARAEAVIGASSPVRLLDLGCGTGGFGLHMARSAGAASLLGIDHDARCIAFARRRDPMGLEAAFLLHSLEDLPDNERAADAAVALDSLYLTGDLSAALQASARLLEPGSPMWLTAYVGDVHEGGVQGRTTPTWSGALQAAGFDVEAIIDATSEWRECAARIHSLRLEAREEVVEDLGREIGEQAIAVSARMIGADGRRPFLQTVRRIEMFATRRPGPRPARGPST